MIFCVEDDNNIRDLLVYTLETTGFHATGLADLWSCGRLLHKRSRN